MMASVTLPAIPYAPWEPTKTTLHLWSQIVGKIRLRSTPHRNQWWNVTLEPSARGLIARGMSAGGIDFELEFDFIEHRLVGRSVQGRVSSFELADGLTVADFYAQTMALLRALGVEVAIRAVPYGVPTTTPFADDVEHHSYDREAVRRWWDVTRWTADVLGMFASDFAGKQSPAHLFWHSFDLALARFNGKRAPLRREASLVEREAYRYEVIAFGFWAGDAGVPAPTYYTYTAPEPPALVDQPLRPAPAVWSPSGSGHLGILGYDAVRESADPAATLLDFYRSGYEAGIAAARWDAGSLASPFPA